MKTEKSAGGIVVRKRNNEWDVLVVTDMNSKRTFPKGKIEPSEDELTAAKREIVEETGITDLEKIKRFKKIHYFYKRNGLISKTVQYFLFRYNGNSIPVPQKEEGIKKAEWIPLSEIIHTIGYTETNSSLLLWTSKTLLTLPN